MTEFTRELMFGKRPVHRTNPKPGQSEWYYLDPRGTDRFEDMKEIDVPSENSPNPYANEIQNYLYENDEYNYKQLYGNTPPPVQTQNNTQPTSGYPELRADKRNTFNSAIESFVRTSDTPQSDKSFTNQIVGAARDLGENYINMVNANYKSTPEMQKQGTTIDNYYHCVGNYDAAQRGALGSATAGAIGLGRELIDYPKNVLLKGKTFQQANDDFRNDMKVNADGRQMEQSGQYRSAYEACDKYRPAGYDPLDRFRYYKK